MEATITLSKSGITLLELQQAVAQAKRGGWRVVWNITEVET